MAKPKTFYLCRSCGAMQPKWMGKCPDCNAWNSLEEMSSAAADPHRPKALNTHTEATGDEANHEPMALADVPTQQVPRINTGVTELDRVLGGGLVPGSTILLGGEPGIGKSTLLLQTLAALAQQGQEVLYVTSEESAQQTQMRARRLGSGQSSLKVYAETNLEKITRQVQRLRPLLCVVDSIQMVYQPENASAPGSISQLRDCATELVYLAKAGGTAVILVGHVTKEGTLAGPKLVEHIVDTVLYFEGDSHHDHRIVRCVKNRFGNTLEIGLFRMTGSGLECLPEAGALLLQTHDGKVNGSVVTPALQGSRVLMVEVQALTSEAMLGGAKRKVAGVDINRVAMIVAVLEQKVGLRLVDRDVFVNVAGGLKMNDPSADAGIALAIAGAQLRRGLAPGIMVVGELGLLGELRPVAHIGQRLSEAQRLGFHGAIVPAGTKPLPDMNGFELWPCRKLAQAVEMLS